MSEGQRETVDRHRRAGARHRRDGRMLVHDGGFVGRGTERRYRLGILGGGIVCGLDGPSAVT